MRSSWPTRIRKWQLVSNNNIFTIPFLNTYYHKQINKILIAADNETFRQSSDPVYAHTPMRNVGKLLTFNPKLKDSAGGEVKEVSEQANTNCASHVASQAAHAETVVCTSVNQAHKTQNVAEQTSTRCPFTVTLLCLFVPTHTFSVPEVVSAEFKFLHFRHAESQNRRSWMSSVEIYTPVSQGYGNLFFIAYTVSEDK